MRQLLVILLALLAVPAIAQSVDSREVGQFQQRGTTVPIYAIGEVLELKSRFPSMDEFAARVGQDLRAYTKEAGVEACAMLCNSKKAWGATLVTIHSQAACPRTPVCPKSMRATMVDIHSHLHVNTYVPTALDSLFLAPHPGSIVGTRPDHFSAADIAGGHGYLASPGKIQYQQDGVVRLVEEVSLKL